MRTTLSSEILVSAYRAGYFPMPDPMTEEIRWYRPDPRAILPLEGFHCSRSLRRTIRNKKFQVTFSKDFYEVMKGCAGRSDTWINEEILIAYRELHDLGFAMSVEVWEDELLVGGLYGVKIDRAFFAESKFHKKTDASKMALWALVEWLKANKFQLLEVQFLTPHLASLGAIEISDAEYQVRLREALDMN